MVGACLASYGSADFTQPWNPATPLPQFITHDYVDPANIAAIAKYRSGVGHTYSDNYEANDRSLKFYFEPLKKYLDTEQTLPLFAPATGTIAAVVTGGQVLSTGDFRGVGVTIDPDGYPAFEIDLFHVDLAPNITVGTHVNAGDPIGYADVRESVDFDLAVGAAWNAVQVYPNTGQSNAAPGFRLLSPCDVMNDATFAHFAPYGITDRSQVIVPLAYRDANPGQFGEEDIYTFDPTQYAIFLRAPDIGIQPASLVLNPGSSGIFYVDAAAQGSPSPLTYQWYLNGAPISDGSSYSGTASSLLDFYSAGQAQAGAYTVVVRNAYGSTTSDPGVLTVLGTPVGLPVITSQPASQTVQAGSNVTLSVGATGYGLSYLWTLNYGYVSGGTGPTLTLNSVGAAQAGSYLVNISNPAGSVTSNPAVLNVIVTPPVITVQPTTQTVGLHYAANLSVTAAGSGLNFQWLHNGLPVVSIGSTVVASTATGSTLTLWDVSEPVPGNFAVTVSNTAGSVTSNVVTVNFSPSAQNSGGGGGGGGGGAPSLWFLGALAALAGARFWQVRGPRDLRS